jgi:hypothetical protein
VDPKIFESILGPEIFAGVGIAEVIESWLTVSVASVLVLLAPILLRRVHQILNQLLDRFVATEELVHQFADHLVVVLANDGLNLFEGTGTKHIVHRSDQFHITLLTLHLGESQTVEKVGDRGKDRVELCQVEVALVGDAIEFTSVHESISFSRSARWSKPAEVRLSSSSKSSSKVGSSKSSSVRQSRQGSSS